MSASWQAGDKAVCIVDNWDESNFFNQSPPRKGSVYLVLSVNDSTDINGRKDVGLGLTGVVGFRRKKHKLWFDTKGVSCFWSATCFRKLIPLCDRAEHEQSETRSQP